ncbi:MAG: hypothetical protein DME34_01570 [Verrucomicrobia bacterium]|nr:MAG: hypothetical protein DME34_01570 [Verrucomicrobiota bacterium]
MLRNIPSAALKELVKLSERKEALMTRIQQIDREIMRVQDRYGVPTPNGEDVAPVRVSRAPRRRTAARRTERGALKERILRILRRKPLRLVQRYWEKHCRVKQSRPGEIPVDLDGTAGRRKSGADAAAINHNQSLCAKLARLLNIGRDLPN